MPSITISKSEIDEGFKRFEKAISSSVVFFALDALYADELSSILSKNKTLMFEYDFKKNELESDKLSKSWINPVTLRYNRRYSTQLIDRTTKTGNYSVYN